MECWLRWVALSFPHGYTRSKSSPSHQQVASWKFSSPLESFFFFLLSVWIYLNMVTFSIIILLLNHLKSLPDTWMLFFRNGWSYNIHVQFMSCLTLTQKRDFPACMLMHLVKLRIKIKGQCILFFVMLISRCLAQWGREHRMSYMKANDSCRGLEVMNKLVEMS